MILVFFVGEWWIVAKTKSFHISMQFYVKVSPDQANIDLLISTWMDQWY